MMPSCPPKWNLLLVTALGMALISSFTSQPAFAASQGERSGFTVNGVPTPASTDSPPGNGASAWSLPVSAHMQCMVYGIEKYQIASYSFARQGSFSGKIKLLCGTARTHGYRHIESRHKKQWVEVVKWDGRRSASAWDDLMKAVVKGNLAKPKNVYRYKGNKMCFEGSATSWRKDSRGRVIAQKNWNTAVVVSTNLKRVITAYPGRC